MRSSKIFYYYIADQEYSKASTMMLKIHYIFKAHSIDETITIFYNNQPQKVLEEISKKQAMIKVINNLTNVKALIRKTLNSGAGQYIRLEDEALVQKYLRKNREEIFVEFFHQNIKESLRGQLINLDNSLNKRQRELKLLVNQLKDQTSQFYAMQIISRTSKTSFSEFDDTIQIAVIISEPLVDSSRQRPLFYEQIDIPRHIQRLKQASLADYSLSIHVQRHFAEMKELNNIFNRYEKKQKQTFIVLFFTRVEIIDGEICMSFENNLGEQTWERAEEFIKNCCNAELLIIIGIGAYLLQDIEYQQAMILISTVSLEETKFQQPALYKDNYSLTFLEILYQSIFKRLDLSQAVQNAQKEANNYYYNHLWCCCLHSHSEQCNWKQIVSKIGNQTAHKLFKHNFQEWKGSKFYSITNQLQKMIIGQDDICARDSICCWNRQDKGKNQMHQPSNQKAIIWNNKSYQLDEGMNTSLKMNKFSARLYDKPVLRVRPATIYKIIQFIQLNFISIIRATKVTQTRRLVSQAFQYVKNRYKYVYMFEILADRQIQIEGQIQSFIKKLLENQLFFSENIKIFVSFIQKADCNSAYERFMKDHNNFLINLKRTFQVQICLSFIIVTTSVFFQSQYPTLHLSQWPSQQQKYYQILHSFNYENISPDPKNPQKSHNNLVMLKQMIVLGAEASQQEVKQKFQEIRMNSQQTFNFLGFLSLFQEEGFYLNKSTTPILEQIFTKQIVDSAVARKLPIDTFVFANCIHFQMSRTCLDYLKFYHQNETIFRKKILKFYNNLFQIYLSFLQTQRLSSLPLSAKQYLKKLGLFSISMESDEYTISKLINRYKQQNKSFEKISQIFYNHSNFKPIYHINQFIKTLSKFNSNGESINDASSSNEPLQSVQLKISLWNITHKIYIVSLILKDSFISQVKQLHSNIKGLLIEKNVDYPIVTFSKIQMQILLAQHSNLSIDNTSNNTLYQLLSCYYNYSKDYKFLNQIKPRIDSVGKFLEIFQNCCTLLYQIKELCEEKVVMNEFSKFGIVLNIPQHNWYRQHLLLIQKKTLFYFNHKKVKHYQNRQNLQQTTHINIGQIRYQFEYVYFKLPETLRHNSDLSIIQHYIDVSISETRVDDSLLFSSKQGYSSQLEPIYQYLSLKIDKKTLFKDKRLVVICRARNSFQNGQPYILNRKRYLTIPCLREILKGCSLKSSYFNFTPSTLENLSTSKIAEILYFVIFADSLDSQHLIIGQDKFVDSFKISAQQIYEYFQKIDIKFIIIVGKNSIKITKRIYEAYEKQKRRGPLIIALQSNRYSMCDSNIHSYPPKTAQNALQYVSNQVYLIGMDLIALYVIGKLQKQLRAGSKSYNISKIDLILAQSIKYSKQIMQKYIEITEDTFKTFEYKVYSTFQIKINRIQQGIFEDLTSKYYSSSQNNFYHYKYYQNVGRCNEIYKILSALSNKQTLIQIIGDSSTGKTTILHEVSWTAQIKNLFEFGISIFDIKMNLEELKMFIGNQKLQQKKGEFRNINKMIAIDNLSEQILIKENDIFLKLRNKSIAIMFTAVDKKVGQRIRNILDYRCNKINFQYCFNMNQNQLRDIYGLLLTNIKQLKSKSVQQKLTKQKILKFNTRINDMMHTISSLQGSERLKRALKFSKMENNQKEQKKQQYRYNFYKVHYDDLISKLKDNQYINVRFY